MISHEEIAGVLDRVLGGRASPLLLNFLKVLSRHRPPGLFAADSPPPACLVRRTSEPRQSAIDHGRARSAAELASRIRIALRGKLEGEPVLDLAVDPKLIGGVVLRLGDTIYDGSIANQLQIIRQQMMDRSVHEIQSRRDRFSNPAGN